MTRKILSVAIRHEIDADPDLSHLGEYSDKPAEICIDREERGDRRDNREYRYFNVTDNYADESEEDQRKYLEQDYLRAEAHNRGAWCEIGIFATAEVQFGQNSVVQTVRSGGLWGVESDAPEYYKETEQEELACLKQELLSIGFDEKQIDAAFAEAERKGWYL